MFDHFRTLFLYTFQINATILYLFPLTFKLRDNPILLSTLLIALSAIFRSYPCVGDLAFYMALIPMWKTVAKCKCCLLFLLNFTKVTFIKNNFQLCPTTLSLAPHSSSHQYLLQLFGICGFIRLQQMRTFILV